MFYVRCLLLRSTFAATAPRSAVAQLEVVRPLMRVPRLSRKVSFVAAVFCACLIARSVWAFTVVRRVTSTVARSVEIGFGPVGQPDSLGHWALDHFKLPAWLHRATFDVAFRPVREFELYYPEHLVGDLGAELLRFHGLRRVTIDANDFDEPTEAQWALLCARLRALPELEELELAGVHITDESIKPLANHPKLRIVIISQGSLTTESTTTFATLPRLAWLSLDTADSERDVWLTTADSQKQFKEALRQVRVAFP